MRKHVPLSLKVTQSALHHKAPKDPREASNSHCSKRCAAPPSRSSISRDLLVGGGGVLGLRGDLQDIGEDLDYPWPTLDQSKGRPAQCFCHGTGDRRGGACLQEPPRRGERPLAP